MVYCKIRPFSKNRYIGLTKVGANERKRLHITQCQGALSSYTLDKCHARMLKDGPARFLLCPLVDYDSRPHETGDLRLGEIRGMRLFRVNMNTINQHMRSMASHLVMH